MHRGSFTQGKAEQRIHIPKHTLTTSVGSVARACLEVVTDPLPPFL